CGGGAGAPRPGHRVEGSTGILPITGTLVHRGGYLAAASGITSYEAIRQTFDAAMADPAVHRLVLEIDSCGGEVHGLFDLADHIYQARGKKPITAVVNEQAYSAAYLLASAADRIVLPRTGGVGSIGVIVAHFDQSGFDEKTGVKVTHIFAGKQKAECSPHAPLSPEAHKRIQGRIDELYNLFVGTVARNRGIAESAVRGTEAGIFTGKKALAAGLADEIAAAEMVFVRSKDAGPKGGAQKATSFELFWGAVLAGDNPRVLQRAALEDIHGRVFGQQTPGQTPQQ
ncbi:MAG: S49 family peptidase, partial [Desulfuromonadales bacterium]|nr:S49 family peptidase [Desulfuromonadales bacterium]